MWRLSRAVALTSLVTLGSCGWRETVGEFTYSCADSFHPLDGPSCELELTEHYLLRYGEGSGDDIVLAFRFDRSGGSGGLFNFSQRDNNIVARLGLDESILAVQLGNGAIYVAPAHPDGFPDLVGPLTEDEFATRYPDAPAWRDVQ